MSSHDEQVQQRQSNLAELGKLGVEIYPRTFRAQHTISALVDGVRRADARRARGRPRHDDHQRPHPRHPRLRQGQFSRPVRRPREDPGLHPAGRAARARFQDLQAARFRRLGRRRGTPVPHQDQRADDLGLAAALSLEVSGAAAGEVARPDRRRDPLPPALSRPHRQPRLAARVRDAEPHRRRHPRVHDGARLSRGRDADDAADRRRRDCTAVRHASQHARHGAVPPDRAGALPEAARRRRAREGVRDQPQLPERGDLDPAQPRVHDDGVLRGVRRLPVADADDRRDDLHGRRAGARHRPDHLRRPSDFAEGAVRRAFRFARRRARPRREGCRAR